MADALAAIAPPRFAQGEVRLTLVETDAGLELRLGPMEDGGAERVRAELSTAEDGEWRDSLERQADGYQARVASLETQYPALRGK